jgi:Zn-dependent peptidase ImmA (M78 family)
LLLAKFLGRILAHELGHVLLNSTRHQPKGLMRAHFRPQDVLSAPISTYTLDPEERALFFAGTGKEIRMAQR